MFPSSKRLFWVTFSQMEQREPFVNQLYEFKSTNATIFKQHISSPQVFEVWTLLIETKLHMFQRRREVFKCFCHLSDMHVRCKWNFIDKTLLGWFTSCKILYLSGPFCTLVSSLAGLELRVKYKDLLAGLLTMSSRVESTLSHRLAPSAQARPCCLHSTLFMRPEVEFQWGALRYVFPNEVSGCRTGHVKTGRLVIPVVSAN